MLQSSLKVIPVELKKKFQKITSFRQYSSLPIDFLDYKIYAIFVFYNLLAQCAFFTLFPHLFYISQNSSLSFFNCICPLPALESSLSISLSLSGSAG